MEIEISQKGRKENQEPNKRNYWDNVISLKIYFLKQSEN